MRYPHTRLHRPPEYPDMVLRVTGAVGLMAVMTCLAWTVAVVSTVL